MFDPRNIDPRSPRLKVRIKNVKSGRYLSLQGDQANWERDDTSLSIRDWMVMDKPQLESPQVWNIIQYRDDIWILMNQFSLNLACIRGRETGNGATAIQHNYHRTPGQPFQMWRFKWLPNGHWLIQNVYSGKYLGPESRRTDNDHHCIQWDDQTGEDNYQEWVFEQVTHTVHP
jgi:hypothetical protein